MLFSGDLGVYSLTIHRQLFDIHHSLICDRPQVTNRLLTGPMLEYADKVISFTFAFSNLTKKPKQFEDFERISFIN